MSERVRAMPYHPRYDQAEIMGKVRSVLQSSGHMALESGTGTGKTICALAPAVSHALDNARRVLYLTHTNAQQRQVLVEMRRIRELTGAYAIGIQGRRSMCPLVGLQPELESGTPEELSRLCGERKRRVLREREGGSSAGAGCTYYEPICRSELGEVRQWMREQLPTSEELVEHCAGLGVCPYELTKLMAREAVVVTAPYIYFFDVYIRQALLEWLGCGLPDLVLVVDEAHNLPDYGRELNSIDLSLRSLNLAEREAEERGDFDLLEGLDASSVCGIVEGIIVSMAEEYAREGDDAMVPPHELEAELMHSTGLTSRTLEKAFANLVTVGEVIKVEKQREDRLPRSYLGHLGSFLSLWHAIEGDTHVKLVHAGQNPRIEAYCLDPSIATEVVNTVHASVHMSGTLAPLEEYRDSIGLPGSSVLASYPSPFPPENRLILYAPDVTTKYEELMREPQNTERLAGHVARLCNEVGRNTMVFFPSYDTMSRFVEMQAMHPVHRRLHVEQRDLSQTELAEMLSSFREEGGVLFSVVGGRLSEGTDLPGKELELVVMVGIPYPKPTAKQRALQYYYDVRFGKGWEYTVKAPATRRLLQCVGRLIRSESDRGVAVILDKRAVHFAADLGDLIASIAPEREALRFYHANP